MGRIIQIACFAVVTGVRRFSKDKERDFNRWSSRIAKYFPNAIGQTYFGSAINCDLNDYITRRIFFFGIWEPEVSRVISSELRPGDVFVDVGANVGYDTLLGSKAVGPNGHVVAIEASTGTFRQLQDNLQRNGVRNVRAVAAAVSDREGELTLYAERGNLGRTSSLPRAGSRPSETVPMRPLDQVLTEDERRRVRLIKIDIEGGELPVLQRLLGTIDLYAPDVRLLVEISEEPSGQSREIFDTLVALGFTAYAVANEYSILHYLQPSGPTEPRVITDMPDKQTDVLFKRAPASAKIA